MYYILNETNQIIAADENLLNLCGVSHIDELSLKIALGDIKFDLASETNIIITTDNNEKRFPVSKITLSSMLGHLTLVEIQAEKEETEENDQPVLELDETEEVSAPLDLDSDLISIQSDTSMETETLKDDSALFDLALEEKAEENLEKIEDSLNLLSEDTETLDLGLSEAKDEVLLDDSAEILIDIDNISKQIGVSHQDYDTFLDEYIDTALGLEQDLRSSDAQKRSNAVSTLSHLSEVLQLPVVGEIIESIATDGKKETVESFYAALSRLTTSSQNVTEETKFDLFDAEEETAVEEAAPVVSANSFGTISLDDVKPIHFDFQLEEAANDLSLPVDLIEEFVHDFIEQGHIETKNMLKAYEEGDLEAIQKIGHLLKGASSNLRIKDLSDTLYKIQFCEDSNDLEHLIKDYWGHFLSFEIQINALAK